MKFTLLQTDTQSKARLGKIETDHGTIETPIFMPVGTQASVKTQSPKDLEELQAQIILGNTYHLYLRPGADLIAGFGGLHRFMSWNRPILTDSGGFQVFSLQELRKIDEKGVVFKSHLDGSRHLFTPLSVLETQQKIGSDIMMVLDECPAHDAEKEYVAASHQTTLKWAAAAREAYERSTPLHGYDQWLFAIVQGGTFPGLREASARALVEMDFPGYAIGGLAVGESKENMLAMTDLSTDILPAEKPRYLMGVGMPQDLLESIERGVDMFDCVMPTRNARNGTVFTHQGKLVIKAARYKTDERPMDARCSCYACRNFSRAYIRHLLNANEVLGIWLTTHHNLHYYLKLMEEARKKIKEGIFSPWKKEIITSFNNAF
ncbi:MAG TPA: tRNA guanosine(34) transglycosylase Tgt [Caldithrix abyssi]|uniref:Queuine tRNA-ribosyltransferase n=1 Tax=Caldithrix abyssi TaxID=187145 RepID=A0A7V5RPW0_CALAY|nr:tRNA guanosine(34) transglycosylase Tgt [Caldithrix abyssi]